MNKPQLSLAFSLSLVLLQANLLSAHAEPQGAIWQRMASSQAAGASKVSKPAQKVSSVKKAAPAVVEQPMPITTVIIEEEIMILPEVIVSVEEDTDGSADGILPEAEENKEDTEGPLM